MMMMMVVVMIMMMMMMMIMMMKVPKNFNIECNIYRYGVMGDDREALEMLGEEVKRSR